MKNSSQNSKQEANRTLTVRQLHPDVDAAITAQAKAAGTSRSDFIREYLSASFGDLIGNFSRTSELVALMDREVSAATGLPLTANWYDAGRTLAENQEYCRLLQIRNEDDLQRIMMAGVPWLTLRARQLETGIPLLPHGIALTFALFIEAASRELPELFTFRRHLFWATDEARFRADIDAIRQARLLAPLAWPEF